jgi:hypothetical protein
MKLFKKTILVCICLIFSFPLIMPIGTQAQCTGRDDLSNRPPWGRKLYDYDLDQKADLWLFNNGVWRIRKSSNAQVVTINYGQTGDIPTPDFYNNLTNIEIAIFRPGGTNGAEWWINTGSGQTSQFGLSTDKPVPGDYDDDGKTDLAVFRPSTGVWYILNSSNQTLSYVSWGITGDVPIIGHFFPTDTKADVAVFRPSNSTWYALSSFDGTTKIRQFGATGDIVVPADYDCDKLTDFAIFRPNGTETSDWWILKSFDDDVINYDLGVGTDFPVPADYDGDLKADAAVYRPSEFKWYYLRTFNGDLVQVEFGSSGEVPVQNILHR